MKAHKKIILWSFWLSVLFLIGTILLYLLQPNEVPNFYQWLEVVTIGILTGLMVACIVEIGNYSSLKNKLYEKLFSEFLAYYNFLTMLLEKIEDLLKEIDKPKNVESIKSECAKLLTINDLQLKNAEKYTKYGDFTFITASTKNLKNKRNQYIAEAINCLNKITLVTSKINLCCNYLNNCDLNSAYIEGFNLYQIIINLRLEIDKCVSQLEQIHKFAISWDKGLKVIYIQKEAGELDKKIGIFRNRANVKFNTNQALSTISGITSAVAEDANAETQFRNLGNNIEEAVESKKVKKKE